MISDKFVAPEIITSTQGYTYQMTDIWSSGAILYYMLFGKTPFSTAKSQLELFNRIGDGDYSFEDPNITISSGAQDYIKSMMEVDPKKRITAAKALDNEWLQKTIIEGSMLQGQGKQIQE